MDRKDWNRIGLVAAILLVPGGFVLGATLAARRAGKAMSDTGEAKPGADAIAADGRAALPPLIVATSDQPA